MLLFIPQQEGPGKLRLSWSFEKKKKMFTNQDLLQIRISNIKLKEVQRSARKYRVFKQLLEECE